MCLSPNEWYFVSGQSLIILHGAFIAAPSPNSRQARCRLQTRPQARSPVAVIIHIPAVPRYVESSQVEQNQHLCIEKPHWTTGPLIGDKNVYSLDQTSVLVFIESQCLQKTLNQPRS